MSYVVTLLLSALCVFVLVKTESNLALGIAFAATMIFGVFIFPVIDGIYEAIKMDVSGQRVSVYSFVELSVEKDWSSTKYWNYMFNEIRIAYWWAVWPAYFLVMYLIAQVIKGAGNA